MGTEAWCVSGLYFAGNSMVMVMWCLCRWVGFDRMVCLRVQNEVVLLLFILAPCQLYGLGLL